MSSLRSGIKRTVFASEAISRAVWAINMDGCEIASAKSLAKTVFFYIEGRVILFTNITR